ncbi:hypothetical protein B4110_3448 [Parageobacillus toebii]|uniref:Uncharacterized protein n=2 Tax=Parageobacillus toebii TaxID=153151 RepID=A0A150MZK9_9BACL|nr:hypothetical protein B4110_3448 [Parageobacillus toebii]
MATEARQKEKRQALLFRLKAAHVLWATAKCRRSSSLEAKCSLRAEVLALQAKVISHKGASLWS